MVQLNIKFSSYLQDETKRCHRQNFLFKLGFRSKFLLKGTVLICFLKRCNEFSIANISQTAQRVSNAKMYLFLAKERTVKQCSNVTSNNVVM